METSNIEIIEFNNVTINNWDEYYTFQDLDNTNFFINFPIIINPNNSDEFHFLNFKNCTFDYEIKIEKIENPNFKITFLNCKFNHSVNINANKIKEINLIWHSTMSNSHSYCNINSNFKNKISISSNKFEMFCKIEGLNQTKDSSFSFIGNVFLKQPREINPNFKTDYTICKISNCTIYNGSFNGNTFYLPFEFNNNCLKYNSDYGGHTFKGNKFQKAFFSKTNFGQKADFFNCDFYGTTLFDEVKNIENTNLHFKSCKFVGFTHFGSSQINSIIFEYILFERNVSFKNSNFNFIKFEETKFEKGAFFDDLNKDNSKAIADWNRTTLREIKRELANSHNQIDYLRFKAYELKAYKKEVDKSNLNWRDTFILYFNEESNNFGLDWTKGIFFIFQWSFLFYILYVISYSYYVGDINCIPKIDNFLVNYLKFINPFSFLKSPIEDAENYFLPFLFFILGKILVSYGIYQTVQAFRKFGVNGG